MDGKVEILGKEWLSQGFMKLAKYTVQHERFEGEGGIPQPDAVFRP